MCTAIYPLGGIIARVVSTVNEKETEKESVASSRFLSREETSDRSTLELQVGVERELV